MKHWILLLLAVYVSMGCEVAFEPLAPSEAAFSVYGYLDSDASDQVVRVVPLRNRLLRAYTEADLTYNTSTIGPNGLLPWTNDLYELPNQELALGSTAAFRPRSGQSYRLVVEDPTTGRRAEATTSLPPAAHRPDATR